MERFGEKVRTLRKQHSLSLRQLASELELATHSHLDRIERGESYPSADLILKIADYNDPQKLDHKLRWKKI